MFTIDTSVWINADSPLEKNHSASRAFLARLSTENIPVIVPTLLRVELAGAVSRMSDDKVRGVALAAAISSLPFIQLVSLDGLLSELASNLAANQQLRGADAVYAAVAQKFGCTLVSLNKEHLERLASVVTVQTPEQALSELPKKDG